MNNLFRDTCAIPMPPQCLPASLPDLLHNAAGLKGASLGELATRAKITIPETLHRHKGWIGQLLEWHLGADGGNHAQPDFAQWGVELKTLPLNRQGKPKESTYICAVSLAQTHTHLSWPDSLVYQKLARVLWIPIEAEPTIPLHERRVLHPFFWTLPPSWEQALQQDWEELMEALQCGHGDRLSAHYGTWLQIRPKAPNSRHPQSYLTSEGQFSPITPKGFYLRPQFTHRLLIDVSRHEL